MMRTVAVLAATFMLMTGTAFGAGMMAAPNNLNMKMAPQRPVVSGGMTTVDLTVNECTSLGGRVTADLASCTNAGQFTCTTVTVDGNGNTKKHTACIDRK